MRIDAELADRHELAKKKLEIIEMAEKTAHIIKMTQEQTSI